MTDEIPPKNIQPLVTNFIDTPFGKLELLTASPRARTDNNAPPILFLHGSNCSSACYKVFLPLFASQGYTAYALSLRNHGQSYKMSWFWMMFLTTLEHFVDDVIAGMEYI